MNVMRCIPQQYYITSLDHTKQCCLNPCNAEITLSKLSIIVQYHKHAGHIFVLPWQWSQTAVCWQYSYLTSTTSQILNFFTEFLSISIFVERVQSRLPSVKKINKTKQAAILSLLWQHPDVCLKNFWASSSM